MKFKYTALGANNQKLEGVLEADSIELAREELHKMSLSVVGISEVSQQEEAVAASEEVAKTRKQEGIVTYYFLAKDLQNKEVNGTIDSKEPFSAYRRLLTEYGFEVIDLYPSGTANPEIETFKGKFIEWKEQLESEGILTTRKSTAGVREELSEENDSASAAISDELDRFIINTKKILGEHRNQYSEPFFREIEKTLYELERVRSSNNLKHITKICNDLYELIANPDMAPAEGSMDDSYLKAMEALKGSGFISNRLKFLKLHSLKKESDRFEKVQLLLSRIYKVFNRKKSDEIDKSFIARLKGKRIHWMNQLSKNLKSSGDTGRTGLITVISRLYNYLTAPNPILRSARKSELMKSFQKWKVDRKAPKKSAKPLVGSQTNAAPIPGKEESKSQKLPQEAPPKRDFFAFFSEIDSFIGWLLFFYIGYFFLASFAIEKNVGLPKELVLKTLVSPLIVNICIFLVFAHLTLTLKIRYFRHNFLGSLFLFFLGMGVYTLLIVNF